MRARRWMAPAALVLVAAGLGATGSGSATAAQTQVHAERGAPGTWTKISTGGVGITSQSGLYRTPDGVLHVVYPRSVGAADSQLGHTAIDPDGTIAVQNDVLPTSWGTIDGTPVVVGDGADGIRVIAGGVKDTSDGFWSQGRIYTMTAPESGASWVLPAEAVGISTSGFNSYGTGAITLEDGTPVAAFTSNSTITWHTGTGNDPDQSFDVSCCAYNLTMVRDGDDVWIAWYANGNSPSGNGTFVRQIAPTVGPIVKAPQSSVGADSIPTDRVALVARSGGGVYLAYCTGYPYCGNIGLWKVGTTTVHKVPGTKYADNLAISPGPSGRMWLAWTDNIPVVHALRTNTAGTAFGPARNLKMPPNKDSAYSVAINGTTSRGDVVINVGDGYWHTQVAPGLTVKAKPKSWPHGHKQKVAFTVLDAGDKVAGAKVKAGSKSCTTVASGKCAITFPKSQKAGSLVAKASKSGYGAGSVRLKVK